MELTTFLASVLGWYLVIVSLFMLFRREMLESVMKDILAQRALLFLFGLLTLIIGLLLVVSHNIWVMAWPVVITLIAWITLISGIVRLVFPELVIKMGYKQLQNTHALTAIGIIGFVLGLYLLFKGYFI